MINGGHVLFNIDTDTSRLQQNGRHSADDIFKSQLLNFKWYFIKMRSLYTNWQYNSIGLGNGSPDRRQAIVCSNDCPVYWRIFALPGANVLSHWQQERQGRWCIFDTGWSHWINYLVKEDTMKVAWPRSNEIILVSGMKIVAKSQSDLWRLIMNSSAKFKADSISGVYAKIYHRIGTSNTNSAKDVH